MKENLISAAKAKKEQKNTPDGYKNHLAYE